MKARRGTARRCGQIQSRGRIFFCHISSIALLALRACLSLFKSICFLLSFPLSCLLACWQLSLAAQPDSAQPHQREKETKPPSQFCPRYYGPKEPSKPRKKPIRPKFHLSAAVGMDSFAGWTGLTDSSLPSPSSPLLSEAPLSFLFSTRNFAITETRSRGKTW